MKLSIIAILLSFSAMLSAQTEPVQTHQEQADTFELSAHHQIQFPQLLQEKAEIDRLRKENERNIEILISAYTDPKVLKGGKLVITEDFKKIIIIK